jgi:pyruvate-formate lyase
MFATRPFDSFHDRGGRISEAVDSLRYKPIKSTTLERLRLCVEAEATCRDMSQPMQLGTTMIYILEHISVPVESDDLILGRIAEAVPNEEEEIFFQDTLKKMGCRPPYMIDGGHESFAWARLINHGLVGLEAMVLREYQKRVDEGATKETLDFLQGMILVYRSFQVLAKRYAEAARSVGLTDASESCFALSERAPRTFREALQLVWLVGYVYCTVCAMNATLTFGRMDEYLYPFYKRDIKTGILTEEMAGDLIEDFYCKNNLILGRGEHQMSAGSETETTWERNLSYDSPQYVILAGTKADDSSCTNELTRLFLEKVVPRFENPVVVIRYTDDFPADLWQLACRKMCANSSMMVYNDGVVIPSLIASGIDKDDAITYEMYGCNWPIIPGQMKSGGSISSTIGCLLAVLKQLHERTDCNSITMDEIYRQFALQYCLEWSEFFLKRYRNNMKVRPGRLRIDDCFLIGPIEKACSWETGSLKYDGIIWAFGYIANLIDSMTALDEIVFRSGRMNLHDFISALLNDFINLEAVRQQCMNVPKFGQDDDTANAHAARIMHMLYQVVKEVSKKVDDERIIVMCSLESDTMNIQVGAATGATPDGRRAGMPLSQNAGPAWGASTKGLTAMLQSLSKLPLNRICSGAVNIKINPGMVRGENHLLVFSQLLRAYFSLGGLQAQLSVTDIQELRNAQSDPEKYRDLMVRITGYSAAFVDMLKSAQDTIIQRDEMAD